MRGGGGGGGKKKTGALVHMQLALHAYNLFIWMLIVHVLHWHFQFYFVFPPPVQTVQATVAVSYKEVPKINGEPTPKW